MRDKMDERFDDEAARCNSLTALCETAKKVPGFLKALLDSIARLKCLLASPTNWLQLKGKIFTTYSAASESQIEELWNLISQVDPSLQKVAR